MIAKIWYHYQKQGSAWFKILVLTGYHWLPEFCLRVVTGYHFMLRFWPHLNPSQPVTGYQRLPKNKNFSGNRPVHMVTKNRVAAPADLWIYFRCCSQINSRPIFEKRIWKLFRILKAWVRFSINANFPA